MQRKENGMKTVQAYLKEMDREKLINEYLYENPIHLLQIEEETLTIKEVKDRIKRNLRKYIERLCTLPIETSEDGKDYILFAHRVLKDGYHDLESSLVCMQDLMEHGEDVDTYGFMFMKQNEVMGYRISDEEFTQKNIYQVLVQVLYEASFFGFEQEYLEEELQKLDESFKDIEAGNTYSAEEIWAELAIEKEERDDTADELQRKVWEATYAHDLYCKQKELKRLGIIFQK